MKSVFNNVEDINRLVSKVAHATQGHYHSLKYVSGIWPDILVNMECLQEGKTIGEDVPADIALAHSFVQSYVFAISTENRDQTPVLLENFYRVLSDFWNSNLLSPFPVLTKLIIPQFNIECMFIFPIPEDLKNASVDVWGEYAGAHVDERICNSDTPSGLYLDVREAVTDYCTLLAGILFGEIELENLATAKAIPVVD